MYTFLMQQHPVTQIHYYYYHHFILLQWRMDIPAGSHQLHVCSCWPTNVFYT